MKALFLSLIVFLSFPSHSMDAPQKQIPLPHEIDTSDTSTQFFGEVAPGVYAGQTKVGNEIVYFGMEKIDENNIKNWDKYKNYTKYLTENSRGILSVWSPRVSKIREIPFEKLQNVTGFADESELSDFLDKLEKAVQENKNVIAALQNIPTGLAGFYIEDDGHFYVVYASKKPVTGRFPFPDNLPSSISLKKYYEYFGDLLMVVRSQFKPDESSYWNRGIFKNPISFIEDGNKYPGLSMKLHGFSAVVAQYISKDRQYMDVEPAPAMRRILVMNKDWQPGDLSIDGRDFFDYNEEELNKFMDLKVVMALEPQFRIKIEALIRVFKGEVK